MEKKNKKCWINSLGDNLVRFLSGYIINTLEFLKLIGYVHMNIKPENLFLNSKMIPYLFNLKMMTKTKSSTSNNTFFNYKYFHANSDEMPVNEISPELLRPYNDIKVNSYNIDTYGFGITLYYMYFGSYPFEVKKSNYLTKNDKYNLVKEKLKQVKSSLNSGNIDGEIAILFKGK